MKIHSVLLENFMLYRRLKRVFGDKDIIGIIGNNKNGKTTIPEAIRYCFHGVSRAEKEIELIHRGADKMMVTVVLDDDGKRITVRRGRDRKNHGLLEVTGVEKKKEAQQVIDGLVGYDKDDFSLTTFFLQGDINRLMELSSGEKKKYMMQWLDNTHWIKMERAALDDLVINKQKLIKLKTTISAYREQGINVAKTKKKLKLLVLKDQDVSARVKKLQIKKVKLSSNKNRADFIFDQIQQLKNNIHRKKQLQLVVDYRAADVEVIKKKLKKMKVGKQAVLITQKVELQGYLKRLLDKVGRAQENMTGQCPVLDEPCDRIECDQKQLKVWKRYVKETKVELSEITKGLDLIKRRKTLQVKFGGLDLLRSKALAGVQGIKSQPKRLKALQAKLSVLDVSNKKFGLVSTKLEKLYDVRESYSERIGQLKSDLKRSRKLSAKILEFENGVDDLESKAVEFRYLVFMFGKNGIPSQEIENAFDEVEDDVNLVLERLGIGLQIEFQSDRELATWEDYCVQCGWQFPKVTKVKQCDGCNAERVHKRKDELQIRVIEDGHNSSFNMESGGGKTLVSLAVRLAMTRLKQRQSHSRFNVLFLDEPDANLDPINKKAFVKLITTTLVKDFGFEQIFWISHDQEIQESIPYVLHAQRSGSTSKARWI